MPPVEKFGQYLLRNQVVTQEQLNEALQCQVIFGGRLGTNLVELGYLTLDDLARLLSRRSGYPAASPEELEELPRDILGSLPRATIEKFKIIPMRVEAKTLHLAVCDPTDVKTMDEIQFATGMRIKPYLLPELRMYYLLEKHYGIKRDIRYIRLGRSLSRGKYAGAMVGTPATVSAAAAPANSVTSELELKGFRKLKDGEELTDEATHQEQMRAMLAGDTLAEQANSLTAKERAAVPEPAPMPGMTPPMAQPAMPFQNNLVTGAAPAAPKPPVAEVGPTVQLASSSPFAGSREDEQTLPVGVLPLLDETHLEPITEDLPADALKPHEPAPFPPPANREEAAQLKATLTSATDRDGAAAACLRLARGHANVVALFIVNKGVLTGWKGAGGALDRQGIESVMLPATAESILKGPAGGIYFQGQVSKGGLNDRLIAALGRTLPIHAMVIPIELGKRVVNLLYADAGHEPMPPEAQAVIQLLARDMSAAYERIILARKKSS